MNRKEFLMKSMKSLAALPLLGFIDPEKSVPGAPENLVLADADPTNPNHFSVEPQKLKEYLDVPREPFGTVTLDVLDNHGYVKKAVYYPPDKTIRVYLNTEAIPLVKDYEVTFSGRHVVQIRFNGLETIRLCALGCELTTPELSPGMSFAESISVVVIY